MMLKRVIVGSLMICFVQFAFGQRFEAGVKGGLAATQVGGDELSGFNKAGLILGGFVNTPVAEKMSVQMEIYFIQKGSRKPLEPDNDNEYYVMRLSYFEIPVLFKWQVTPKFNIELGPSIAVLIFSEEEDQLGVQNNRPPFNTLDYGIHFGLTYPLADHLFVNARLSSSIVPMRDFPGGYSLSWFDKGQYNTVVAFALHYQF